MDIVFLSNFYNHHQAPFSEKMFQLLNGNFYFISCNKVTSERASMGWMTSDYPGFVYQFEESRDQCVDLINNADVVIIGSAPYNLIKERLKEHRLTFMYSERWDKESPKIISFLKNVVSSNYYYGFKKNLFCLCSSAFTAYDVSKRFILKNRCYKWGYFPEVVRYENIEEIIKLKRSNDVSILFVSRLIKLKHPELPIQVARRLKEEKIRFHLTMIGIGDLEEQVVSLIGEYDLTKEVTYIRSMTPSEIRRYMERSSVFLFTSDRNEGWGAVLNESMNSGCALAASSEIGSVPYLLRDGKNGYIYQDGNFDDLYCKVRELCLNQDKREQFGIEAYNTMVNMWNAENAAKRFLELVDDIQKYGASDRFKDGPCSKAEILKDGWYK